MMAAFGLIALWRWSESGSYFFILLALRDFVAAKFFATRTEAREKEKPIFSALAYISTALPLCYSAESDATRFQLLAGESLVIFGFLLVTLATIELAHRFGIAPVSRGSICKSGVYAYLAHPMYTGYILAEMGLVVVAPHNLPLFVLSTSLYVWRALRESAFLRRAHL